MYNAIKYIQKTMTPALLNELLTESGYSTARIISIEDSGLTVSNALFWCAFDEHDDDGDQVRGYVFINIEPNDDPKTPYILRAEF